MHVTPNSKMIILVLDINDADYVSKAVPYSDEIYEKLNKLESLSVSELDELIDELEIGYFHDDMRPHTLKSFFVADIHEVNNVYFKLTEFDEY